MNNNGIKKYVSEDQLLKDWNQNDYGKIHLIDFRTYEGDTDEIKLFNALEDLRINKLSGYPRFTIMLINSSYRSSHDPDNYIEFDIATPVTVYYSKPIGTLVAGWYCLTGYSVNYKFGRIFLYDNGNFTCEAITYSKLNKNQGEDKAGQYLVVGSDGNITTEDINLDTYEFITVADIDEICAFEIDASEVSY